MGDTHRERETHTHRHTHRQTSWAIKMTPSVRAYAPTRSSKPHPRAPPPDPRLKLGPVFVTSGGVRTLHAAGSIAENAKGLLRPLVVVAIHARYSTVRLRAMNAQTPLNSADSFPKQPKTSQRTAPLCLPATGPNDKRLDLAGPISSSVAFCIVVSCCLGPWPWWP